MEVTLAHSPDSDDAFMFYALACKRMDTGPYQFKHVLEDIESLNKAAEVGKYTVTAISFHNYPFVSKHYQLLSCGASVGDHYGPTLVSKTAYTPEEFCRNFSGAKNPKVIAVPGEKTTAFLALKLFLPEFHYEVIPFDQIMDAVSEGRASAGLLIHEGQLNFAQSGLKKIVDLGVWWRKETGLPLPLGGNVIKRDLGKDRALEIARILRKSIEFSLSPEHQDEALDYALQFARGLDRAHAERFVHMYVNQQTLDLDPACAEALRLLYRKAAERGLIPHQVPLDIIRA